MSDQQEDLPPRRRASDMPSSNMDLVLYQISELKAGQQTQGAELKAALKEAFAELRVFLDGHEQRIASLERKDERRHERETLAAKSADRIDSRWVPIAVAIFGGGGILFTIISLAGH